jgi:hypothetical protein
MSRMDQGGTLAHLTARNNEESAAGLGRLNCTIQQAYHTTDLVHGVNVLQGVHAEKQHTCSFRNRDILLPHGVNVCLRDCSHSLSSHNEEGWTQACRQSSKAMCLQEVGGVTTPTCFSSMSRAKAFDAVSASTALESSRMSP